MNKQVEAAIARAVASAVHYPPSEEAKRSPLFRTRKELNIDLGKTLAMWANEDKKAKARSERSEEKCRGISGS